MCCIFGCCHIEPLTIQVPPDSERKYHSPYAGALGQSTPSGGSVFTELNLKLTVADKGELLPQGEIPCGGGGRSLVSVLVADLR